MYNSDLPSRAELPTSAQLIKSTIIAIIAAIIILVTIVVPTEYAIDPTGIGRMLKLTEMGEIKKQLATEAAADAKKDAEDEQSGSAKPEQGSSLLRFFDGFLISQAFAAEEIPAAATAPAQREDETVIVLKPTEGVEWKMEMPKGAEVQYSWAVAGGVANFDMHGTPANGDEQSYKKGRGAKGDEGTMTAAFDGTHGWFWRNRGDADITITLKTSGVYTNLRQMKK